MLQKREASELNLPGEVKYICFSFIDIIIRADCFIDRCLDCLWMSDQSVRWRRGKPGASVSHGLSANEEGEDGLALTTDMQTMVYIEYIYVLNGHEFGHLKYLESNLDH